MKDLHKTLKIIKPEVDERIKSFKDVWEGNNSERLFQELAFCLLTPQSKAENAWNAILLLDKNNLLYTGNSEQISIHLNTVRFKNNKARYIVKARETFSNNLNEIKETLSSIPTTKTKREWLVKNITGYGLKESSHFLRNIGFSEDIAILDRHILRNLVNYNVIDEIPKSITQKIYLEIENKMELFSKSINISMTYLDFIFWYNAKSSLFK